MLVYVASLYSGYCRNSDINFISYDKRRLPREVLNRERTQSWKNWSRLLAASTDMLVVLSCNTWLSKYRLYKDKY